MSEDERYNGWANWDTWATMLVLENTETSSYWLSAWSKNFKRKIKRGAFDKEKALLVVKKYIIPAARGKGSHAKTWMKYHQFVPEPDIDPKKVDKNEILKAILEIETDEKPV